MWDLAGVGAGPQRRRHELVRATFAMIAKNGLEGLRTRDIADLVGVNIATLHYYFPTKESLIKAVLDQAMTRFRSTLTPHGSPADQQFLRRKVIMEGRNVHADQVRDVPSSQAFEAVLGDHREGRAHKLVSTSLRAGPDAGQIPHAG